MTPDMARAIIDTHRQPTDIHQQDRFMDRVPMVITVVNEATNSVLAVPVSKPDAEPTQYRRDMTLLGLIRVYAMRQGSWANPPR